MEVFSLLKYWRTTGGATTTTTAAASTNITSTSPTTIRHVAADGSEDDGDGTVHDDGPFFDLEFTVPDDDVAEQEHEHEECDVISDSEEDDDDDDDSIVDFTVDSSCSTGNRTDPNISLSPSDDLFFSSRFVPLEPSELGSEPTSKLQIPGSLRKPATKLRVLMLGFKKSKCASENSETKQKPPASVTVKLKVEEVPIVSLFTRDNSSRNSTTTTTTTTTNNNNKTKSSEEDAASDDKRFAKDVLQKYLKMVKPLYFKVSKRYGEKTLSGFSGQLNLNSSTTPVSSPSNNIDAETKQAEVHANSVNSAKNLNLNLNLNLSAGLRNVRKHLAKSRSASSAVAAAPLASVQSRRHDDSLLQQQDGIQSAILHCKRSFTASRESDTSALSRCTSDPSHEKSSKSVNNTSRTSLDETRVKL